MKMRLSNYYIDLGLSRSRSRSRPRSRSKSIRLGLCACFIQCCLFTILTRSVGSNPHVNSGLESLYCASSTNHASCSSQDNDLVVGCEDMINDYMSPGELFDYLMEISNCRGEFILDKTGFNLTMLEKYDPDWTSTWTHCVAGFDPHRKWDQCSNSDRSCDWSVEVCDADRPGKNCFTTNSTHVNGYIQAQIGSDHYEIYSVFLDGQLPCTRCLLQMKHRDYSGVNYCAPVAIRRGESASKDKSGSDQETVKTTVASTTAVNDEKLVKTTIASTPQVNDEVIMNTNSTIGTKPISHTTQSGEDIDDSETAPPGVTTAPSPPDGDQLDIGEKGTNSGNYKTQVGHVTIFFSTILTLMIVLV